MRSKVRSCRNRSSFACNASGILAYPERFPYTDNNSGADSYAFPDSGTKRKSFANTTTRQIDTPQWSSIVDHYPPDVAAGLERHAPARIVLDPVMVAKSGDRLLEPDAVAVLQRRLVPRA